MAKSTDNLANTDGIQFQFAAARATYQFTNPKPQVVPLASVFSNNLTQAFDNGVVQFFSNSDAL